jgi:1,4-dihydroxy-6-naphthoate synthase
VPNRILTFAHSPDPDDAFMFYGFAKGAVRIPGHTIRHHLEDIQSLNERAFRGEFEITAVSAHAYAHLADRYWVLSCGASVGRGYGPILVARPEEPQFPSPLVGEGRDGGGRRHGHCPPPSSSPTGVEEIFRIAIPGKWTTAALVLDLWLAESRRRVEKVVMPFDQILPAVVRGEVDQGLLIHEGQLTYSHEGLVKVWDAGEWWEKKTGLPLPLGLDVVRADLGLLLAKKISRALRESIRYANAHPKAALEYALQFGRGLKPNLGKKFIRMYVNRDTLRQGPRVQDGLKKLYELAFRRNLIPRQLEYFFV